MRRSVPSVPVGSVFAALPVMAANVLLTGVLFFASCAAPRWGEVGLVLPVSNGENDFEYG